MLPLLARIIGSRLEKWKWKQGKKYRGLWIGPPPKLLSEHDLLCGDVLFCGDDKLGKLSCLIRSASAGGYVHCALYIGKGMVVDVVSSGIRKMPFNEFLSHYSYIAATRCPGNAKFRGRRNKIFKFACASLAGGIKGYNYVGAALSPARELFDLKNLESLWKRSSKIKRGRSAQPKRVFCSEFIVDTYVACGYVPEDHAYLSASRRTPSGLAEENIFELIGYMSSAGWSGISREDHFLAGAAWVLSEEGRARLAKQDAEMLAHIGKISK
jgi:hypothetical protein